jgi:uncharacterized membrane protein YeiB
LWPADILHFYGIYIAVGAVLIAAPASRLWGLAACFSVAFVLLLFVFNYETGWNWDTLEYSGLWTVDGMIRHLFFNGFHPVIPWTAFLLAGMWLGRQDLTNPRFRRRVLVLALTVAALSELASRFLTRWALAGAGADRVESIEAVFGTSPMPPMPLYLLAAGGVAFVAIALCVWLTERAPHARWQQPFVATGRLALTLYVAHVVLGMGTLDTLGRLEDQALAFSLLSTGLFCLGALVFSTLWLRKYPAGPLEALMRRLTR